MKDGSFLRNLPQYLTDTDFPPAASKNVVPFADGIATVRVLGGWRNIPGTKAGENAGVNFANTDVFEARRSAACNVPVSDFFACPKRLVDRISPYANAGIKDITVVLDNIPESLVKKASYDKEFGQNAPPKTEEISWHIGHHVAKILKSNFPRVTFRYRVGTECGDVNRFNGSEQQYFLHYTRISDAIHKHVGSAIAIMPFNQAGYGATDFHKNVSMQRLAPRLGKARVYSAQPVSLYLQKKNKTFLAPLKERVEQMTSYWDALDKERSASGQPGRLLREVHELGVLRNRGASPGEVVSPIQLAAFHAEAIMRFARAGVDKVFHWHNAIEPGNEILTPTGWVYSVLDSMVGGIWKYPNVNVGSADERSDYFATLSRHSNRSVLMISSLNPRETITEWKTPVMHISIEDFHERVSFWSKKVCMAWVRKDSFDGPNDVKESLTLKPFEGSLSIQGKSVTLRPLVKTNSVTAIVFDHKNNC